MSQMLDRLSTRDGWRFVNDLAVYNFFSIGLANGQNETQPLVLSKQTSLLGPAQAPEVYFIARQFGWACRTHLKDRRGNHEMVNQTIPITVPGSVSGNLQTVDSTGYQQMNAL